jgi:hypothetical protein
MKERKTINPCKESDFFTLNDFDFEVKIAKEYLMQDIPSTVFLFKIDYVKTKNDDIYGETISTEKITLKPIELRAKYTILDSETVFLGDGGISKEWGGDLSFKIFMDELEDKKTEINLGDFIGVVTSNSKMNYYEVIKRDKLNDSNKKSIGGLKSLYREFLAKKVDKDIFQG